MRNFKFIASEYTKIHHFEVKTKKKFSGKGALPPPPVSQWGGDSPSPYPTPIGAFGASIRPGGVAASSI